MLCEQEYKLYTELLKSELIPAFGCTEPAAVAYAAARVRELTGELPERIRLEMSRNIIKNAKCVVIPHTGGLRGIRAAAAAGIIAGNSKEKLQALEKLSEDQAELIRNYLERAEIEIRLLESDCVFDLLVTGYGAKHTARVRVQGGHTNVVLEERDGETVLEKNGFAEEEKCEEVLTVRNICEFAKRADLDGLREILRRQIEFNEKIALEGIRGDYGANVGKTLLKICGDSVMTRARALAAAGSDARMDGCGLPVVINSGSGNQGLTVSVPVVEYAKELRCSEEKLYRALILSNLTAIHLKRGIGRLSAYCGAVSAAAAAGAAITYLRGGGQKEIEHTIVNTLANTSGIICDGAKASCAAKIATALDAAILGGCLYEDGQEFKGGEGIVKKGVEETIKNVARLGRRGMRQTDREILEMMTE